MNDDPQKGWIPLFKKEAAKRGKSVSWLERSGSRKPVVCCKDDLTIAKLHCSDRIERTDEIWADFDEEWKWIRGQFRQELQERWYWVNPNNNLRLLSVWLDIDERNPTHRDFDVDRDNFIVVSEQDLKQLSTDAGTMHIHDHSFRNGRYELEEETAVRYVNDWDRVFL